MDRGEYTCTAHLKYPTDLQVYNESRLDLDRRGRELISTQGGRGEYLCKVISSTHPMCRCIMRAGWTWLKGEGSFLSHRRAVANTCARLSQVPTQFVGV